MSNDLDLELPELLATEWEWGFELPPAWTFQGVCYSIIDMWTQEWEYQWNPIVNKKIRVGFEFADDEDKIHTIFKEFTLSFGWKSKLRQFIDSWNWGETKMTNEEAKGFNVYTLLGKEATINVVRKKSAKWTEYADIGGLSPRIKKIELHERKNKNSFLHLSEKYFNADVFDKLPNFLKDQIQNSPEYKALYWITDIDEQEKEIAKEIEQKQVSQKEAEDVFSEDEAIWKAFVNEPKKVEDNPFGE